jgi:hypothetical protein
MMTSTLDRLVSQLLATPPTLNHLWERSTTIVLASATGKPRHVLSARHGRYSPFQSSSSASSRGYVCNAAAGPTISEERLVDYFRLLARVQKSQERSLLPSIGTLSDQADELDGIPLDALLEYEADPAGSRRVIRTDARGLDSVGRDDGDDPTASPSITRTNNQEGQQELEGGQLMGTGIVSLSYIIAPIDRALNETHQSVDHHDRPSQEQEHEQQHVVTCTGFLVESQASKERILVTCAHTLWQSHTLLQQSHKQSQSKEDSRDRSHTTCNICSGCVARDQLGNVFLVRHVLGALASADLLFFKLVLLLPSPSSSSSLSLHQLDLVEENEDDLIDSFRHFFGLNDHHHTNNLKKFTTLPVSPYPLPLKSPISIPQWSPSSSSSSGHIDAVCFQWEVGRVVEYKDTMGIKATVRLSFSSSLSFNYFL